LVSFSGSPQSGTPLSDLFDIFVGMVSGCDEIFRNEELGNISVRESETGISRFIFYEQLPDEGRALAHLQANKERLMKRGIRAFTEETWFEWGAPRNISKIRSMAGRPCIYVKTLTRSTTVAFIGRVEYFGGGLICLIPKPEFGNKDLQIVVDYLHGEEVNRNFRSGGRFKIGQRHLCNLVLPENPTRD
jgi:adenine-specific DNA-methyltransferase